MHALFLTKAIVILARLALRRVVLATFSCCFASRYDAVNRAARPSAASRRDANHRFRAAQNQIIPIDAMQLAQAVFVSANSSTGVFGCRMVPQGPATALHNSRKTRANGDCTRAAVNQDILVPLQVAFR